MKLSTKGRYAMVALADIALQPGDTLVSLGDISGRQDISLPYLEQLFVKLRRADLVTSVRGPGAVTVWRGLRPRSECPRYWRQSTRQWMRCTKARGPRVRRRAPKRNR